MWFNVIVALSNLSAFRAISLAYEHGDVWTFRALAFVAFFSFVSHLVENHKHGMSGIGLSQTWSYLLNRMDLLGVFLTAGRFMYLFAQNPSVYINTPYIWIFALPIWALLAASEYDKYNPELRTQYVILHCAWHCCIFKLMYRFLLLTYAL